MVHVGLKSTTKLPLCRVCRGAEFPTRQPYSSRASCPLSRAFPLLRGFLRRLLDPSKVSDISNGVVASPVCEDFTNHFAGRSPCSSSVSIARPRIVKERRGATSSV